MRKSAVIVAGGSGKRMGSEIPKQFLLLGDKPILIHTLLRFLAHDPELILSLVLPKDQLAVWEEFSVKYLSFDQIARIIVGEGGASRTESVHQGLLRLERHFDSLEEVWVAIHDGVRPFVKDEVIKHAFELAKEKGASLVCVPVKSSMREIHEAGKSRAVDRSRFYHVQTPQTFSLTAILQAFVQRPHNNFTDDASLYDDFGGSVAICEGSYDNIKITTPEDIALGESILKRGE
ncbi:MAG: 2-C-methyl-D-erythritol 4-phosphate cytidylyltransferase [Bacteroidia bacterium]|nr:2-C-methyl-D-erythritol 4-phosphate cytidylyltransferase [Bacteroidia bacterium]